MWCMINESFNNSPNMVILSIYRSEKHSIVNVVFYRIMVEKKKSLAFLVIRNQRREIKIMIKKLSLCNSYV